MNITSDETALLQAVDLLETLRQIVDPEIGLNIVDLGLIYAVAIRGSQVRIAMTLTTPGCPMGESLTGGVQCALLNREEVDDVVIELVWDPPWTPERIAPGAQAGAF